MFNDKSIRFIHSKKILRNVKIKGKKELIVETFFVSSTISKNKIHSFKKTIVINVIG